MPVERHSQEGAIIRNLIPLCRLSEQNFASLCQETDIKTAKRGQLLFRLGDPENQLIYLLAGKISLKTPEFKLETIEAGTESARFALAHQIPRKVDAITETDIRYLTLDADKIKTLLTQNSSIEESNFMIDDEPEENDDDWMTALLKSPIFRALPPANLQRILIKLETVSFARGEVIIKQGDPGDYYYLIKQGACIITRQPSPKTKPIKLGQLKTHDTFGEDALLSNAPRSVSVIAATDTELLRLDKQSFIELIKEPSLKFISHPQAQQKIEQGAIMIDIRPPDEFKKQHLENSINIPFFSLRMHLKTLDKNYPVITVCDNGKNSEAAAFLLLRNKFEAWILEGGIASALENQQATQAAFAIDDGVEIAVKSVNDAGTSLSEEQTDTSEPDIAQLKQRIEELEKTCAKLAAEKEAISKKYIHLRTQIENARKKS